MQDIPPEIAKAAPGIVGAAISAVLSKEHPVRAFFLFVAGAAASMVIGEALSTSLGIPESFSGFMVGVYGIAVINKGYETLQAVPLAQVLTDGIRKFFRLKD